MKWLENIKRTFSATILCLRFPFLYPRNRFTGLHYHSYDLLKKIGFYNRNGNPRFFIHAMNDKFAIDSETDGWGVVKKTKYSDSVSFDKKIVLMRKENDELILSCGKKRKTFDLSKFKFIKDVKFKIDEEFSKFNKETQRSISICLLYDDKYENVIDKSSVLSSINFNIDRYYTFKAKLLSFYHNYVLQLFHCLTSYTELDAMENGWRKAFGLRMCKDIRKALLKQGLFSLLRYRIICIKEKYGSLVWDDNSSINSKVYAIKTKYEDLSYKTCWKCGEKAKYRTVGYILPYCENCISEKEKNNAEIID